MMEAHIRLQAGTDRIERFLYLALVGTGKQCPDLVVIQFIRVRNGEFVRTTLEEQEGKDSDDTENLILIIHSESIL